MGTTYTVTAKVKCWKRHECVDCGCEYRYLFQRSVQGQGGTEQAAQANANKNVDNTIKYDVDVRPCPGCGRIQPDMIGQVKAARHGWTTWLTLIGAVTIVILGASHAIPYSVAGMILGGLILFAMLIHVLIAIPNPNANLEGNLVKTESLVGDGTVEITQKGRVDDLPIPPSPMKGAHWFGILAGVLAAAVALAPMMAKSLKSWPTNPDFVPEVVGPGDEFKVWFPTPIQACKGYWSGSPQATIVNASEVGVGQLSGTGNNSVWGARITGKSVSNQTTYPYAHLTLPNDAKLVGKTIRVRMTMNVRYPLKIGGGHEDQSTTVTHEFAVTAAAPSAGSTYTTLFWSGCAVASLLAAACGFYLKSLANALRSHAIPAVAEPIRDEPSDD